MKNSLRELKSHVQIGAFLPTGLVMSLKLKVGIGKTLRGLYRCKFLILAQCFPPDIGSEPELSFVEHAPPAAGTSLPVSAGGRPLLWIYSRLLPVSLTFDRGSREEDL